MKNYIDVNPHTNLVEIGMPRVLPPTTMYR
jgi:hypothetical protein